MYAQLKLLTIKTQNNLILVNCRTYMTIYMLSTNSFWINNNRRPTPPLQLKRSDIILYNIEMNTVITAVWYDLWLSAFMREEA